MIKPIEKINPVSSQKKYMVAAGKIKKKNNKVVSFKLILEKECKK